MQGLGILGGSRTRRSGHNGVLGVRRALGATSVPLGVLIAYQIDMRTAGASTRTDGVFDAASCSALARLLSDISANPTSIEQDETTHDAEIRIVNGAAQIQGVCAAPAPSTATGTGTKAPVTSTAVPTQWSKDARVLSAQQLLNAELSRAGCSTKLGTDGLIGSSTCGALQWAVPRTGLSADLIALVRANSVPFGTACSKYTPIAPSCPAAQAPPPAAPPPPEVAQVSGKALMVQLQGVINQALDRYGYKPIPVTGKWDAATCGAGAAVNPLFPLGDPMRAQMGNLTAQVIAALGKPCGTTIAGKAPTKVAAPAPVPPTPKPPAPAPPKPVAAKHAADPCYIEFGTSNSVVREMQGELNKLLDKNGYKPIPVTGKWDAASCGAMYVLGGQFDPYIAACRGGYWSVPASCAQKTLPQKKAEPAASPRSQASMLGYGILAAIGAVGIVYAKKKGFF